MKIKFKIMLVILMISIWVLPAYASERVIYDISQITDEKVEINLKWNTKSTENIKISTIEKKNDNIAIIGYEIGKINWSTMKLNLKSSAQIILYDINKKEPELKDIIDNSNESYFAIYNLYSKGVINGYEDNTYKPDKNVTRQEFASIVTKAAGFKIEAGITSTFKDVLSNSWSKDYIMTLAGKGILQGKGDGKFAPIDNITIGEVATIISKTFEFYIKEEKQFNPKIKHWSNQYINNLVSANIIKENDTFYKEYNPTKKATREECALLLNRTITSLYELKHLND